MKKKLAALALVLLLAAAGAPRSLAVSRAPEMEIDVALRSDGSARVTQIWTTEADEGTEFYLACSDSGYLSITDFSVSDKNGPYDLAADWDVDASFAEKARRCGVVETDEGVELCWGISEYGGNCYTIAYVLRGHIPMRTGFFTDLWTK